MNFERYNAITQKLLKPRTLLGVGPMSKLCVDATIELVNLLNVPIQLIASRRQIECKELGGGYVNNWDTASFAQYVREKDEGDWIMLARDHGGPWQGTNEDDLDHVHAMQTAKRSLNADIAAGFDVVHLDPSLKDRPLRAIEKDIETLFDHCENLNKSDLIYECGTEETNGKISNHQDFTSFAHFCSSLSPKIKFCVGQTGTHVKETRNVGTFDASKASALAELCHEKNLLLKEHNLDYSSWHVLQQHRTCAIDAANVAPEFGVIETQRFIAMLKKYRKRKALQRFQELVIASGRWKKWAISQLDDHEKVMIAGHYLLSHPEVQEMYSMMNDKIDMNDAIKNDIKHSLLRYLRAFGWVW